MTEREMFEKSFQRPSNYFDLDSKTQWEIDKSLGILDWDGAGLSKQDKERFHNHYKKKDQPKNKIFSKEDFRAWLEWNSNSRPGEFQRSVDKLIGFFDEGFDEFVDEFRTKVE